MKPMVALVTWVLQASTLVAAKPCKLAHHISTLLSTPSPWSFD